MEPFTTAALITAGSNVLGKALAPSGVGPSRADSGVSVNAPDFGGFAVSFGSGSVSTAQNASWMLPAIVAALVIGLLIWHKAGKK